MNILLPSLAVLIPILTLPFWFFYFDITPKVVVLLAGTAIACAMLPWWLGPIQAFVRTRPGRRFALLLCLQAVALALSTGFSANPALSIGGTNWRMFGLVTQMALLLITLFIGAAQAREPNLLTATLRAIAASGSLIAVYAILQYAGWDPLLPSATYHIGEGEWTIARPPGTVGHADYLGAYLVFAVFLGGSLAWTETARAWRAAGCFTLVAGSFAIVLSGTRSAMLALAFGAALLLFQMRPNWKWTAGATIAATVLLTGFYFSPWGLKMRGRARWFREDPAGGARPLLWRDSLRMAADRPLTGWGPEMFSAEFPRFQSLELARLYPDFYHESPHNVFLDEFAAKGIPGALPFVAWCWFAVVAAWRALRNPRSTAAAAGAALLAGLFCLQFNAFVLTTALLFFLTSAILLAGSIAEPSAPRRPVWLAAIAAGPLFAFFMVAALAMVVSDIHLAHVRTRLENGDVIGASNAYAQQRRWDPRPGSCDLYYARNMGALVRRQPDLFRSVKAWQEAVQAGIRATRLAEDRHNAYYHLASLYAQVNNAKDAEKSLRGAIERAPNWFKPHWLLAQVLGATGRKDEAIAEAEAAIERDAGKHPELTETLRQMRERR